VANRADLADADGVPGHAAAERVRRADAGHAGIAAGLQAAAGRALVVRAGRGRARAGRTARLPGGAGAAGTAAAVGTAGLAGALRGADSAAEEGAVGGAVTGRAIPACGGLAERARAGAVGAAGDVEELRRVRVRIRRPHVALPVEREDAGHEGRGGAGAAHHDPAAARRTIVEDRHAGVGIRHRRDVGRGAVAACGVGLEARLGDLSAARAAGAAPRGLRKAARVGRRPERGAADAGHEGRGAGIIGRAARVATVTRGDENADAGRGLEEVLFGARGRIGASPAVADDGGAKAGRGLLRYEDRELPPRCIDGNRATWE